MRPCSHSFFEPPNPRGFTARALIHLRSVANRDRPPVYIPIKAIDEARQGLGKDSRLLTLHVGKQKMAFEATGGDRECAAWASALNEVIKRSRRNTTFAGTLGVLLFAIQPLPPPYTTTPTICPHSHVCRHAPLDFRGGRSRQEEEKGSRAPKGRHAAALGVAGNTHQEESN